MAIVLVARDILISLEALLGFFFFWGGGGGGGGSVHISIKLLIKFQVYL